MPVTIAGDGIVSDDSISSELLSADTLRSIASELDKISKLEVEVTEFKVDGYLVKVRRRTLGGTSGRMVYTYHASRIIRSLSI